MATTNSISQQLLDLLATRNYHPEMLDKMGKPSNAEDAKTFTFDYISGSGKNYGTMVIVLDSDNEMKIMYGDNLGRTMEGDDKSEFFDFLQHLNQKATSNRWTHSIADINQLKHTMQGMAAIQEGLFEGYYGTKKVSYAGEPTQARLQIVHSQPLGEGDARYRHIDRMFIETAEGEKFKLGFKSLSGARAMLEHVRQGGKPYDIRGCHISETVNEIAVLSRFNRASANRILEGVTQELVTEAQQYYQTLRENLKHMATGRGYAKYFESWHPATINEQEGVVDNIKTLFIEQSIDSRIEAALPLLAKIQQRGQEMKEADIFENWINNLAEGTWTLPETPEQLDKLKTLMTKELIVGPDATNATEQLYDLVGDDELFDRLHELAEQDPRANAWNDTEVMNRLAELGVELPEPVAPGNPAEPQTGATAPVAAGVAPNPAPQQPIAEAMPATDAQIDPQATSQYARKIIQSLDQNCGQDKFEPKYNDDGSITISKRRDQQWTDDVYRQMGRANDSDLKQPGVLTGENMNKAVGPYFDMFRSKGWRFDQPVAGQFTFGVTKPAVAAEGDNLATFESTLDTMRKAAGVPILKAALLSAGGAAFDKFTESRLMDSAGETMGHILNRFKHEVKNFEANGDLDDDLYHALYDYYSDNGEMPYGVAKARDGDPYNWISDRLSQELGVNENLIAPMAMPVATEGAGCNMTMEGEYCPEHGLAECGGMYETMDEGSQLDEGSGEFQYFRNVADPNYRAAIETAGYTTKPTDNSNRPNELILDAQGKPVGYLMNGYGAIIAPSNQEWVEFIKSPGAFHDKLDSMWADEAVRVGTAMAAAAPKLGISLAAAPLKAIGQVAGQAVGAVTAPIKAIGRAVTAEGSNDDPMNYNAAITGSYYESREGDAVLARIKSLALLK